PVDELGIVLKHRVEALLYLRKLLAFAAIQSDRFSILPDADQPKTKIRLFLELQEIEANQHTPEQEHRDRRANDGINHEKINERTRDVPQDAAKGSHLNH